MLNLKIVSLLLAFVLLISCSSAEYKEALRTYEQAQKSHKLSELVLALKKLAKLKPYDYQEKLTVAEQAESNLKQAQKFLAQKDDYSAYLLSHESYRALPSIESKRVLAKSGKRLFPLLKIKRLIDDSLLKESLTFAALHEKYYDLPITDWNLIEVNALVNQLAKNAEQFKDALNRIRDSKVISLLPEISFMQNDIKMQLSKTIQARDYLPKLAKYRSAKLLTTLNKKITEESIELLSRFPSQVAKNSMRVSLIKAKEIYSRHQNLVENLSLSSNISSGDKHANWYQDWRNIENDVLEPASEFSQHPLKNKEREKKLNEFAEVNALKLIDKGDSNTDINSLNQPYPMINALIKKLTMDKSILL